MKSTTAEETAKNLDSILAEMPFKPTQFASDQGSEFSATHPAIFDVLVEKYGLIIFKLKEPKKASMVEMFIRTLKTRLERYFTENNTRRWIDVLPKISDAINNTVNRSIGIEPNRVTFENRKKIFKKLYGSKSPPAVCKYSVGDKVRIPLKKTIFDKGYKPNWSKEIYRISQVLTDKSVCYYKLENQQGEKLNRFYYHEELNLVIRNEVPTADEQNE